MTSGWDVYYVVFLSALLALMFPGFLGLVSRLTGVRSAQRREVENLPPFPHGPGIQRETVTDLPTLGRRVNTRFFLGVNVALTLLTLAFILVPCVGALHANERETTGVAAVSGIVFIAILAAVALLYASRKGDLDWLRSYRAKDDQEK